MNNAWSMDFMHDSLTNGRKVRILNIMDDRNKQALCIEPAFTHSGISVANAFIKLIEIHGKPTQIRCDNAPEFISTSLATFCNAEQIELKYIQPGKPTQNAFIERFNRSYREDILDAYCFDKLTELLDLSNDFKEDYNLNHPHRSLKSKSPINYLKLNRDI